MQKVEFWILFSLAILALGYGLYDAMAWVTGRDALFVRRWCIKGACSVCSTMAHYRGLGAEGARVVSVRDRGEEGAGLVPGEYVGPPPS